MDKKLLFDTSAWLDDINNRKVYEAYVDECRKNEITPASMDSDTFMGWCIEVERQNMEDTLENFRCSSLLKGKWVIVGTLGLWNGPHAIEPVVMDELDKAVIRCTYDDIKLTYDSDSLQVSTTHHDGTNTFTIRKLSQKGIDFLYQNDKDDLAEAIVSGNDGGFYEPLPELLF